MQLYGRVNITNQIITCNLYLYRYRLLYCLVMVIILRDYYCFAQAMIIHREGLVMCFWSTLFSA